MADDTPSGPKQDGNALTLIQCGGSKCDHTFEGPSILVPSSSGGIWTKVCSKCKRTAFNISLWEDE